MKGDGNLEDIRVLLQRSLMRTNSRLAKRLSRNLEPYNLSGAMYGIIRNLGTESLTLSELSQRLLRVNSNTTALIDSLEKKGWVERVRDPEDRRVIRVRLTAGGNALYAKVLPQHTEFIRKLLEPLTDQEVIQALALLTKIETLCERDTNAIAIE
jgi:DNA-binding MarR family transcriptional regulator